MLVIENKNWNILHKQTYMSFYKLYIINKFGGQKLCSNITSNSQLSLVLKLVALFTTFATSAFIYKFLGWVRLNALLNQFNLEFKHANKVKGHAYYGNLSEQTSPWNNTVLAFHSWRLGASGGSGCDNT